MIPLMKSTFLNEFETRKALSEFILTAPRLSMGENCIEFERKFAEYQGADDAVLFNSGGSANLAIIQSLKNLGYLQDGDMVGFSALTWSTNVMPIIQLGMQPIPIDCSISTLNIMASDVIECIKKYPIKVLFLTNVLGFVGDIWEIKKVCDEKGIVLLEDNCESLGTETKYGKSGSFGVLSSFSFFVAHHMSSIEGGMVCVNDKKFSEMLRIVRANGWDRNLNAQQQHKWREKYNISSEFEAKYTFYDLGYNIRPTEITGFLGNYQIQFLDEIIGTREKNYHRIVEVAKKNDDFFKLSTDHISRLSNFSYPVVCKSTELRDFYIKQFSGAGIELRPLIAGNITNQPFFKKYQKEEFNLPNCELLHSNSFYFGNYPELTDVDIEAILSCLISY